MALAVLGKRPGPEQVEWLFLTTLLHQPPTEEAAAMLGVAQGGPGGPRSGGRPLGPAQLGGIHHEPLTDTEGEGTIMDCTRRCCLTRRGFLGTGLAGTLGLALSPAFQKLLGEDTPARRARACILLWLNGGPSHIDTFDPKPGQPTNGPFKAIDTRVSGVQVSEHLPKIAEQAKHLAIVRSLTSKEADHDLAYQLLHTGNLRSETVEYPAPGSVAAREWTGEDGDLPAYVALNGACARGGIFRSRIRPLRRRQPGRPDRQPGPARGHRREAAGSGSSRPCPPSTPASRSASIAPASRSRAASPPGPTASARVRP